MEKVADRYGSGAIKEAKKKMKKNNVKSPADQVKGKSGKYTEYK